MGNTFGQTNFKKPSTATRFEYGDKLANTSGDASLATSRVSERALIAFSKSFPGATNAKWSRIGNKYAVDFTKDEKKNKSLYNVKGSLIYSLCYGSEKDLPKDIRKIVKREYVDYNITQAVEAHEDNRNVWIINLNDDDSYITVAVENGSLDELSHFKKAKN